MTHAAPSQRRLYLTLLALITAAFVAWILSLPLFPSQDGPVHLYYTSILHDLLFTQGSFYAKFFVIKHVLPPYSLYYYLLMGLAHVGLAMPMADKIVICLYMVSFAFGLRYLATGIGPNGDVMALLAMPLLLNWPLAMGFVNFCLSTSFALWALGLWCRSAQQASHPRRIAFVLLAYAIMLTHPVPLIFLCGFCGLEFSIRVLRTYKESATRHHLLTDAIYLALAAGTFLYVRIFTVHNVLAATGQQSSPLSGGLLTNIVSYLLLRTLIVFAGHGPGDTTLRLLIEWTLVAALLIALDQLIRQLKGRPLGQAWTIAQTWAALAFLLAIVYPFIPPELNASHYFSARLALYVWIAALVAASACDRPMRLFRPAAAAAAVALAGLTLVMAQHRIAPIAHQIAADDAALPPHQTGLMLFTPEAKQLRQLSYDPYHWAGTHVFRQSGAVLYDSPWLDLGIIAIGPGPALPNSILASAELEDYYRLRPLLQSTPELRDRLLSHVDFVLLNNGVSPLPTDTDPLLNPHWTCTPAVWYSLCRRQP